MNIISDFFVAHLQMSSIVCVCALCIQTYMYVFGVSGAILAQAALGRKVINHSVCCEQVGAIENLITQDFSCVS